jgi:hypothetical protein
MKPFIKLCIVLVAAAALSIAAFFLFHPGPVWYVDTSAAGSWARFIRRNQPPFTRIRPWDSTAGIPRGVGFYITQSNIPGLNFPLEQNGEIVIRYDRLSGNGKYNGALLLALDPWMVFSRHSGPPLRRSRAEGPGEGTLILSGAEQSALWAWTAQLAQEGPGNFPSEKNTWENMERSLAEDTRFQRNAASCAWTDALSLLLREDDAWLYAPFSLIMDLPSYRSGLLNARIFPMPSGGGEFGIQASLLWAIPTGPRWQRAALAQAETWLADNETQSLIANEFHLVPARPDAKAGNPLGRDAQLAWLSSSFVWQPAD